MPDLAEYCRIFQLCPVKTMNLLQEWGVVSDECITVNDVSPTETDLAIRFTRLNSADLQA